MRARRRRGEAHAQLQCPPPRAMAPRGDRRRHRPAMSRRARACAMSRGVRGCCGGRFKPAHPLWMTPGELLQRFANSARFVVATTTNTSQASEGSARMQAPGPNSDAQRAVAHHQQLLAQATMSATAAHPVIAQQMHQQRNSGRFTSSGKRPCLCRHSLSIIWLARCGARTYCRGKCSRSSRSSRCACSSCSSSSTCSSSSSTCKCHSLRPGRPCCQPSACLRRRPRRARVGGAEKEERRMRRGRRPVCRLSRARRETRQASLAWGRRLWAGLRVLTCACPRVVRDLRTRPSDCHGGGVRRALEQWPSCWDGWWSSGRGVVGLARCCPRGLPLC